MIDFLNVDIAQDCPFDDEEFEIVYSHMVLHYWNSEITKKVFDEVGRVLEIGGVLAILLNSIDDPEIDRSEKMEDGLYKTPSGLMKRFFTINDLGNLVGSNYKTLVLDSKGKTYKDEDRTLVRFIGTKL